MSNMKSKERRSLCEESMLVFVNILKLSSLSLARRTLVPRSSSSSSSSSHPHHQNPFPKHKTDDDDNQGVSPPFVPVSQPQRRSSKRSQKPEQPPESKLSYVMVPEDDLASASLSTVDGQFSDYIRRFHEKTKNDVQNAIVEGKAADYIKRFHEKNLNDLNNESMRRSRFVMPPPPPKVFK